MSSTLYYVTKIEKQLATPTLPHYLNSYSKTSAAMVGYYLDKGKRYKIFSNHYKMEFYLIHMWLGESGKYQWCKPED